MITQTLALAKNAFTESIRQPIYIVLLLLGFFAITINLTLSAYTFDDDTKLMIDLNLSTVMALGLVLASFTASSVVAREIENKTMLTIVSKPVSRPLFIIGKFLGVAAAVSLAYYCWTLVVILTIRHGVLQMASQKYDGPVLLFGTAGILIPLLIGAAGNYFFNRQFGAVTLKALVVALSLAVLATLCFTKEWGTQSLADIQAYLATSAPRFAALLLILQAVWFFCALAVAASTRVGQILTLILCGAVFLLGIASEAFFAKQAVNHVRLNTYSVERADPVPITVQDNRLELRNDAGNYSYSLSQIKLIDKRPNNWELTFSNNSTVTGKLANATFRDVNAAGTAKYDLATYNRVETTGVVVHWYPRIAGAVIPNLQALWLADALTQDRTISARYVAYATVYASLCIVMALALGVALFQTRQTS